MHYVAVDTFRLFRGAITEILLDESFTIETPETKACLSLARKFIALLSCDSIQHRQFADWIYAKLSSILDKAKSGQNVNEDHLWQKFHSFRSSEECCRKWKSILSEVDLTPYPMFYQHMTQELFELIIGKKLKIKETVSTESTVTLSTEEENVVRYIGGYVIRMLKKALHSPKDKEIMDTLDMLTKSSEQSISHDHGSEQWTKALDRGGLIHISDEAFECFCAIEVGIRRHLNMANIDDMDNSFRSRLVSDLVDDSDVQFSWCIVGHEMDEECSTECLEMIVNKWITIRGFSFAKSMVELYKQECKKSTQKSKGLRGKLSS